QQPAPAVEAVERDAAGRRLRQARHTADVLRLPGAAGATLVQRRRALGVQRVVLLAEEPGVGAGPGGGLAPAEVAGQVDVVGQVGLALAAGALAQVLADRAHARRVALAGGDDVRRGQLRAGVAGDGVVAAGLVGDATDQRGLVHPL